MLFNSLQFLLFFVAVLVLHWATPQRWRWFVLLAASYGFYAAWDWRYLGLIILSTAVDYVAGLQIEQARERRVRKAWLLCSIAVNLGILFTFKYFNFFIDTARELLLALHWQVPEHYLQLGLPVGISFYTFQTLSYTIDVYRGEIPAERHAGRFALFVSFFPQLVAGPIERAKHLLPQFKEPPHLKMDDVYSGLNRIAYGLFKKIVIADRLAVYVNAVFGGLPEATSATVLVAACFFLVQVYCDFSGYSDIAVGTARLLGYDLRINFNRPFIASSFTEYWKRWHISLTNWVRDYLYIPLGGKRVATWRWHFNVVLVFVIMGLWHGANLTFIVWGALHGTLLALENAARKANLLRLPPAIGRIGGWLVVMSAFALSMIFFRAEHFSDAMLAFGKLAQFNSVPRMGALHASLTSTDFAACWGAIGLLALSYGLPQSFRFRYNVAFLLITTLVIILFGVYENLDFVYFQF